MDKSFKSMVSAMKETEVKEYYKFRECRELLMTYIEQNELDKDVKRGFYKADPHVAKFATKIEEGNLIRKDQMLKK